MVNETLWYDIQNQFEIEFSTKKLEINFMEILSFLSKISWKTWRENYVDKNWKFYLCKISYFQDNIFFSFSFIQAMLNKNQLIQINLFLLMDFLLFIKTI